MKNGYYSITPYCYTLHAWHSWTQPKGLSQGGLTPFLPPFQLLTRRFFFIMYSSWPFKKKLPPSLSFPSILYSSAMVVGPRCKFLPPCFFWNDHFFQTMYGGGYSVVLAMQRDIKGGGKTDITVHRQKDGMNTRLYAHTLPCLILLQEITNTLTLQHRYVCQKNCRF